MEYEEEKTFKAALKVYAATKAAERLKDRPFDVDELTAIITQQLWGVVKEGVSDYTVSQLATGNLKLDANMHLTTSG